MSSTRIFASPLIPLLMYNGWTAQAGLLFATCALSDVADGAIARRFPSQASVLGTFLDPMSDKCLAISTTTGLACMSIVSPVCAGLLVTKDVCLMAGTVVVRQRAVKSWRIKDLLDVEGVPATSVAPTALGKGAAVSVSALLGAGMMQSVYPFVLLDDRLVMAPLELAALSLTLSASIHYLANWKKIFPPVRPIQ